MNSKMIDFKNKTGWLYATLLISFYTNLDAQFHLQFDLKGTGIDSGQLKIELKTPDSLFSIYSEHFNGSAIDCFLNLESDDIKNHEVLKWEIISKDSTISRTSYVMADDIFLHVGVEQFRFSYPYNHKLFDYYDLVNNFDGTLEYEMDMINELIRLRKNNACTNFVDFLIHQAVSMSQNPNVVKTVMNQLNIDTMVWKINNMSKYKIKQALDNQDKR